MKLGALVPLLTLLLCSFKEIGCSHVILDEQQDEIDINSSNPAADSLQRGDQNSESSTTTTTTSLITYGTAASRTLHDGTSSVQEGIRLTALSDTLDVQAQEETSRYQKGDDPFVNKLWMQPNDDVDESSSSSLFVSSDSSSCYSHETCTECLKTSSWCHWCASDQACHVIGSVYGCVKGVSNCSTIPDDNDDNGRGKTCSSYNSCKECSTSSRWCHWCASDNACHAKGSVYGCTYGVDCFSNDRCQRKEPEPFSSNDNVESVSEFRHVQKLPLVVLLALLSAILLCTSFCFLMTCGIKGAYVDLMESDSDPPVREIEQPLLQSNDEGPQQEEQDVEQSQGGTQRQSTSEAEQEEEGEQTGLDETEAEAAPVQEMDGQGHEDPLTTRTKQDENGDGNETTTQQETDDTGTATATLQESVAEDVAPSTIVSSEERPPDRVTITENTPLRRRRRRRRSRSMQLVVSLCTLTYIVIVATCVFAGFVAVFYYPRVPQYNICNDEVAWDSLMNSLTKMKVAADFQILASVANPNRLDVELVSGNGSFIHDGAFVGTFDIPPTTVKAMSITDVLIVAHLTPEKWQALSIVAEYYRGKLILFVNAQGTLKFPALSGYSFSTHFDDLEVHVNELSDRHMCTCQKWDNNNKTTTSYFTSSQADIPTL